MSDEPGTRSEHNHAGDGTVPGPDGPIPTPDFGCPACAEMMNGLRIAAAFDVPSALVGLPDDGRRPDPGPSLSDFLLARIAEDEAAARELADAGPWRPHRNETDLDWEVRCEAWGHMVTTGYVGNSDSRPLAQHIARWDPARVLAECEAKRRIARALAASSPEADPSTEGVGYRAALRRVCELLAVPYADHPDYRQEWRP